jgi:transcriptional regulator with XRE-family HTH domain
MHKDQEIGKKVKKLRELRNFTQLHMAEKLGISQNGYSKMERGNIRINEEQLQKIAEALGVKVEDINDFDDKKIFFSITQSDNSQNGSIQGVNFQTVELNSQERKLYEENIQQLKNENSYLKTLHESQLQQLKEENAYLKRLLDILERKI